MTHTDRPARVATRRRLPTPRLLLAALALLPLAGCSSVTERLFDDDPAVTVAFATGFVVAGAPPVLATLPLTLPFTDASTDDLEALLMLGFPTGVVGGVAVALPVWIVERVLKLPGAMFGALANAVRRRSDDLPPCCDDDVPEDPPPCIAAPPLPPRAAPASDEEWPPVRSAPVPFVDPDTR